MLKHADIWRAIDQLAEKNALSASGLARKAGLDATTFNPSKRKTPSGRDRWPSTESVAKILTATGFTLSEFVSLIDDNASLPGMQRVPLIGYAQAGDDGYFDDSGFPTGAGWDEVLFPDVGHPNAYALKISGDSMLPLYRPGDLIIVAPTSELRTGDRAVVKTKGGEVLAKEVARATANRLELRSLNPAYQDRMLLESEVEWAARILWARQ
ncbi:MAG: helix-turn-helix transcriptional regulator [Pseudomonadota bacterium]